MHDTNRSFALTVRWLSSLVLVGAVPWLHAQDYSVLRINEVITDNETTGPLDSNKTRHDMVEIYNSGDVPLVLGSPTFAGRLALSDTAKQPIIGIWTFPALMEIPARGFLVIFLESNPEICDPHGSFALANDGSEPITLWGKAAADSKRPIIDQVWLPPLRGDVSFGRYPDGAGSAPMPVSATFDYFKFHPPGQATFGACQGTCTGFNRICTGAPNSPGGNLAPSVSRAGHSTNHPAAGEALELIASVKDDKEPLPPNIARVFIRYRVNGGPHFEVDMSLVSEILRSEQQPLDRWTLWKATIPGQPAGTQVEFTLHVVDAEGLTGDEPNAEDLCPEGIGPCNALGVPGPGCAKEGLRFRVCEIPFRYVSGYQPHDALVNLVINEVVSSQRSILQDITDSGFDDFFEVCNPSDQAVDLSGLWLSDRPFTPKAWQFPSGSSIAPGQRLLIWADGDGGWCPRPGDQVPGDGQDCPDPTASARGEYHTSFRLEGNGDELYLFDRAETGFGVIHGVEFGMQPPNTSWSLIPDCDRSGDFALSFVPTPRESNGSEMPFRRGNVDEHCPTDLTDAIFILTYLFLIGPAPTCPDAADVDDNGSVELTDPVFLLLHLFQGGNPPPLPGTEFPGPDPTIDALPGCFAQPCP